MLIGQVSPLRDGAMQRQPHAHQTSISLGTSEGTDGFNSWLVVEKPHVILLTIPLISY